MPDLEKVIQCVEWCVKQKNDSCDKCSYDKGRCAIVDAISFLKLHDPIMVIGIVEFDNGSLVGRCPACGQSIVNMADKPTKFCKFCGQAVKWE